jgi:dehydrogenase/reductase SDR family protein 7B
MTTGFKDKVIWITGASSGVGEALAIEFAKLGARLILSARRVGELQRVGTATKLSELDLLILPFDLSDTSLASGFAAQVINKFGRIDLLVNNGGFSQRSNAMETSEKLERELIEVNYFAHVNISKAVLPYMKRQKSGHIVVISSVAGKFGFFLRSSYSAAKHALHGYFESLRLENERSGIKILLVCPGKVKTSISINAAGGDGSKHNVMDPSHENAMSPAECALQIINAIKKEKEEIYIGGKELLIIPIKRFFPALFRKIIRRQNPL